MFKKKIATTIAIIILIFLVGFILRVETTGLSGIPNDEKTFYEDQNGLPYMYELDSYYNYRMTQDYLDHGYLGDTIINSTEWDLHSYYPPGRSAEYPPLIAYLAALSYKFANIFANMPLIVVCFWLPAFIAPLSGVIAYLFTRKYTNEYGAIVAGIFAVTSPLLLSRTVPGWFDTDMFNVLFPLLVTWLFFEAIDNRNNLQKGAIISIIAAFSMFLFSIAWEGWQYIFYIIILFSFFYILWCKFKRIHVKNFVYVFGIFFISTLLMVLIFSGLSTIISLFTSPFELINIFGSQGSWNP
ncbi:MAG: STT3 domain-containing protein, partial [Methanobacterium sp.]